LATGSAVNFAPASFRGLSNTDYAGWEIFTSAFNGPNVPDDPAGSNADARIRQTVAPDFSTPPGILLSGSGNIYSGFQNMNLVLSDTAPADLQTVVLQTRVLGSELDYSRIVLTYTGAAQVPVEVPFTSSTELFRQAGAPIFGNPTVNTEFRFQWDLSAIADTITSYSIRLTHTGAHLSIDRVELDTQVIPTPGAMALIPLTLLVHRRRR
jgi:hypothetical protein